MSDDRFVWSAADVESLQVLTAAEVAAIKADARATLEEDAKAEAAARKDNAANAGHR